MEIIHKQIEDEQARIPKATPYPYTTDYPVVAKLKIQVLVLPLATSEVGLPEGCKNFDLLPSTPLSDNLFAAIVMLEEPAEKTLRGHSCSKLHHLRLWIEITKTQASGWGKRKTKASLRRFDRRRESGKGAYGIVVNSFEELEPKYVATFTKVNDKKVWCIGPVSLCNKTFLDISEKGNSVNKTETT